MKLRKRKTISHFRKNYYIYKKLEIMEEWRDIEGYEGLYQVSNLGRVKSLPRFRKAKNNSIAEIKEKILKQSNQNGYLGVSLCKGGVFESKKIHKLVAIAFLNHKPNGHKIVVDHIDENRFNNCLENLQLISNRENVSKSQNSGTSKFTGVCWDNKRGKWLSQIYINGKNKYLGYFDCELAAATAYNKFLNEL